MANQIVVEIIGDSSKFNKATDDAVDKGGKFGSFLKGGAMGVGFAAVTGGLSLVGDAVGNFIGSLGAAQEAYRQDQSSQALMKQALANNLPGWDGNTKAIEDYAAAQVALGFQDDDIRASMSQLIGITHDQEEAMRLNSMAQDLARSKGIDLAQATDIITKAAQGNGKALKSLGIDTQGATDAASLLDAVQQNVAGSAEAWADTSEGRAAVAQAKQAEAWEKIGGVVDRITQAVLPVATTALELIADVIENVSEVAGPFIEQLVKDLTPAFQNVVKWVGEASKVIGEVAKKVLPPVMSVIGVLGEIVGFVFGKVIIPYVGILWNIWSTVFGKVVGVITGVVSTVMSVKDKVIGGFKGIVDFVTGLPGKIGNAVKNLWDGIPKAFKAAINLLIGIWNSLGFTMPEIDLPVIGKIGGFRVQVPQIPYLHSGGVVPGVPGSDVLTMLQAGERVIPRNRVGSGQTVNINFYGPVYGDGVEELTNQIAMRLRLQGVA